MSSRVDKLQDQRFRRTAQCSRYLKLLREKSVAIPTFDDAPIDGKDLTVEHIRHMGTKKPLLIKNGKKDLHMRMPESSVTLTEISKMIGPDTHIKVIDVGNQEELEGWTFGDYAKFFEERGKEHKILNLISLEVSSSPLATKIQGPSFVRQVDWIDAFWPSPRRARGDFPRVQKYLLAGMQGAYTDFHLDFGGTSVWYHVLWGEKVFYFIRPTGTNLIAFEQWSKDSLQSQMFLPDLLPPGECFKIHLRQGDTMIIPGGWVHAVYTPADSLVFGGNFIHSTSIIKQLQVYGIEERTRVGKKYRFPYFKQLMWLALTSLLPIARRSQADGGSGSRALFLNDPFYDLYLGLDEASTLKQWIYLVQMCDLWVRGEELSADDKAVFASTSGEVGCLENSAVISSWMDLIRLKINSSENELIRALKDTLDSVGLLRMTSKEFLLSLCRDATFDADCEMPAVQLIRGDAAPEFHQNSTANLNTISDFVAVTKKEFTEDGRTHASTPEAKPPVDIAVRGSGIRLKLKLSGGAVSSTEVDRDDLKKQADVTDSVVTPLTAKTSSGLSIDVHMDTCENLFGSDGEDEAVESLSQNNGRNEIESTAPKKSFNFHLKPQSNGDVADSVSVAPTEMKTNLAFKVKKIKKIKATELIKEDTLGKERYGTRGLKLSATFLQNAADYDGESDGEEDYALGDTVVASAHVASNGVSGAPVTDGCHSGALLNSAAASAPLNSTAAMVPVFPLVSVASAQRVGQKRRRAVDDDFIFDVNDAADEDEYQVSDEDAKEDEDWIAGDDERDEEYEEGLSKRRKVAARGPKAAAEQQTAPTATAAPVSATNGMRIKIGSVSTGYGATDVPNATANKIKMPGSGVTKSGTTIRQQLMKKLGSKYK